MKQTSGVALWGFCHLTNECYLTETPMGRNLENRNCCISHFAILFGSSFSSSAGNKSLIHFVCNLDSFSQQFLCSNCLQSSLTKFQWLWNHWHVLDMKEDIFDNLLLTQPIIVQVITWKALTWMCTQKTFTGSTNKPSLRIIISCFHFSNY